MFETLKYKASMMGHQAKQHIKSEARKIGKTTQRIAKEKARRFVSPHSHLEKAVSSLSQGGTLGRANAAATGFKARMEKANAPRGDARFQ